MNVSLVMTVNMSEIHSPADLKIGSLSRRERNYVAGMDFDDVVRTIGNAGKACIGFGESLDAENAALDAVKNALQSPLFIDDIRRAGKALLVFIGGIEFLNMLEMNEASTFLDELRQADWNDITLWQVDIDEPFDKDGVAAFVLATNFKK